MGRLPLGSFGPKLRGRGGGGESKAEETRIGRQSKKQKTERGPSFCETGGLSYLSLSQHTNEQPLQPKVSSGLRLPRRAAHQLSHSSETKLNTSQSEPKGLLPPAVWGSACARHRDQRL